MCVCVRSNSPDTWIINTDNRFNSTYVWTSSDGRKINSSTDSRTSTTYYRTDITFKWTDRRTHTDLTENTKDFTSHLRVIYIVLKFRWNLYHTIKKIVKCIVTCTKLYTVPVNLKHVNTLEPYNTDVWHKYKWRHDFKTKTKPNVK